MTKDKNYFASGGSFLHTSLYKFVKTRVKYLIYIYMYIFLTLVTLPIITVMFHCVIKDTKCFNMLIHFVIFFFYCHESPQGFLWSSSGIS